MTSPFRVRDIQPFLGLSASQPSPSAYARADASSVPCNDISFMAILRTQALSIGTREFAPAATNAFRSRMASSDPPVHYRPRPISCMARRFRPYVGLGRLLEFRYRKPFEHLDHFLVRNLIKVSII